MKLLIVAAGQGGRLREKGEIKPLLPVRGIPLIERVIGNARRAGIDEFLVVSGYRGDELRAALDGFAAREGVALRHVVNGEWQRANGVSVMAARPFLEGDTFLLAMCDHIADPAILRALVAQAGAPDRVTLAVDFAIADPINDPLDATRVRCEDGRILRIGKLLADYDAFDTGFFLCTPAMFAALEESQRAGDDSISGAMGVLARQGRAFVLDIGDRVWVDVDDPADVARAEHLLDTGRL
jgi:1L-myo-inositol 1-phosphate cytidylyltransferase